MTHFEKALEEAQKIGGYISHYDCECKTPTLCAWHERRTLLFTLLDPLFWQALGKARGWRPMKALDYYETDDDRDPFFWYGEWQYRWHRFIDHLADGKDAESFFADL